MPQIFQCQYNARKKLTLSIAGLASRTKCKFNLYWPSCLANTRPTNSPPPRLAAIITRILALTTVSSTPAAPGRRHHSHGRIQRVEPGDVVALFIGDALPRRHAGRQCKFRPLHGEVLGRAYERPPV